MPRTSRSPLPPDDQFPENLSPLDGAWAASEARKVDGQ
jgi:hypothetical protein